ncbi:MAG: TraR/DksA family transcriptional regulator [Opitutales bacterium]
MAKNKKKSPAKKKAGPTPKPAAKPARASAKGKPAAKSAPKAEKKAPAKAAQPAAKRQNISMEKSSKKSALRDSILARKAAAKPIAFSLDEVRAIAKTVAVKADDDKSSAKSRLTPAAKALATQVKPAKPNHVKAASLTDILGFNPAKPRRKIVMDDSHVPEKFKRYYKLLIDLRNHLTAGIELHSEETLKRSAKDDAGDLSSYGQHMADAGTDTFDRDFALSLVSSEQEALSEIEAAIKRIDAGTYGLCEITGKPIAKERLLAVPFTRYSAESQKQIERNRHRSRTQAGLFGESGEDSGKIMDEDSGNE